MRTWAEIIKKMIEHYTPLFTNIKIMFGLSKGNTLVGASTILSVITTLITYILNESFLGVSVLLLVVVAGLIMVDQFLGTAASAHKAKKALLEANIEKYEEYKFKSTKIMYTVFKFMSIYLWLLLSFSASTHAEGLAILEPTIAAISLVPIFLFGLREYVSIGESLQVLFGKKPYLFTLADKIFDTLQLKFFKKLGASDEENADNISSQEDNTTTNVRD